MRTLLPYICGYHKNSFLIKRIGLLLFMFSLAISFAVKAQQRIAIANTHELTRPLEQVPYHISGGQATIVFQKFANPIPGKKNSVAAISPLLNQLRGVKIGQQTAAGSLRFKAGGKGFLLIGVFNDTASRPGVSPAHFIHFGKGKLRSTPVIRNGLTLTGLPPVDVYAVAYIQGTCLLEWTAPNFLLLGLVKNIPHTPADAALPDGRLWEPFLIEGFADRKPVFDILGGPETPVIDEHSAGAKDIQGGFEGGACVKVGNTYHLFPTERAGQAGQPAHYDRVKTRIGHWTSTDAIHWKRQGAIFQASGAYSVTHDDNPLNDRRGAIWSYMPVFNKQANRWYGYYLCYTVDRDISPNHSFGRIWRTESATAGINGIGGPYKNGVIIMEPGWDSQLWEGRQGVDSFYPYQVGNQWLALYGGAYPYRSRKNYPDKLGKGWFVGLAKSASLEGPWTRLDTTVNPIKTIHPWFIENPIVYQLAKNCYITVFDGGPEGWGHHLPNMMGYSLSADGYHWSEATYLPIETKVKKWWDIMRTPTCLIDEGNNVFTIVYAAIDLQKRFHPMGKVQLKLNRTALAERMKLIGKEQN